MPYDGAHTRQVCAHTVRMSCPVRLTRLRSGSYLEGRWEGKGTYVFYLELVTDLLHLCVYVVFFFIVFTNYGLPLHLARAARPPCSISLCAPCALCARTVAECMRGMWRLGR